MNKNAYFVLFTIIGMLYGCKTEVRFTEKIIDNNAPKSLWMKTVGDIDGDEKTDLILGGRYGSGLVAYLAPDWKKQIICDTLRISTSGKVCDIDNNGAPDITVITDKALVWLSGPNWKLRIIDSLIIHDVEQSDINNDGLIDLIARDQSEFNHRGDTLFIFSQTQEGGWNKHRILCANGEGLKIFDINKDGRKDIIINGYWFENTGDIQNWTEHKFSDTWNWRNTYIDVADINNDGAVDIVLSPSELAGNTYHISWFEAPENPASNWEEHIIVDSIESVIHFIGASDFNKDGKMDLMYAEMTQGADPDEVAVLYQQGENIWKKQVISEAGCHSMQLLDCDEDGDIDAFGANWNDNIPRLWINEGK